MQPFRKLLSARIYFLSFIEALIAAGCYIAATFIFRPVDAQLYLMYEEGAQHIGLVALTFLFGSYLFDFYKEIQVRSRLVLILQLSHLIGVIIIAQAAFAFVNPDLVASQSIVLGGSVLTLLVLIVWRMYVRPGLWNVIGAQKVLFVGYSGAVERLSEAFREQPMLGMEVMGYILEPDTAADAEPILGDYRTLRQTVAQTNPDRVIVGADELRDKGVLKTLFDLRSAGVTVESAADAYEAIFGRIYSRAVEPYTVIFRNELSAKPGSVALQSIYTNLLALTAVVIALPLMVLIAIALKLTRKGPVLVKHTCVGLHGIPFNRYRFQCDTPSSGLLTRLLTRYRLDALPETLNIVRGEMALIGPRAERVEFSEIMDELIPFYRQKYSVKPGMMGWSQLHCDIIPTEDTVARIEYDLYYIKHISLVLDAYTVLRAIKWVLADNSAEPDLVSAREAAASAPPR
jgi:lipopolysaccharide/colanic/teichoic acid biosynthesis glycosyltransferase